MKFCSKLWSMAVYLCQALSLSANKPEVTEAYQRFASLIFSTRTRSKTFLLLRVLVISLCTLASGAVNALTVYSGFDSNNDISGSNPLRIHPKSDASRTKFIQSLNPDNLGTQDFEGLSPGYFPSKVINFFNSPVTGTLEGVPPAGLRIGNVVSSGMSPVSGQKFLSCSAYAGVDTWTMTFSTPITALGFYATDLSDYFGLQGTYPVEQIVLKSAAGSTVLDILPGENGTTVRNGSVLFFGVTDFDNPFTAVSFRNPVGAMQQGGYDEYGVDDLIIGQVAVPEPNSIVLFISTALAMCTWRRRT